MQGDKLIQAIKGMFGNQANNFVFGVVTSVNPIKIIVEGLPELQPTQIILSDKVKEKKIKIPNTEQGGDFPHTHEIPEITLWRGLEKGDKVFIIRSNNGQTFYVMEVVKSDTD